MLLKSPNLRSDYTTDFCLFEDFGVFTSASLKTEPDGQGMIFYLHDSRDQEISSNVLKKLEAFGYEIVDFSELTADQCKELEQMGIDTGSRSFEIIEY